MPGHPPAQDLPRFTPEGGRSRPGAPVRRVALAAGLLLLAAACGGGGSGSGRETLKVVVSVDGVQRDTLTPASGEARYGLRTGGALALASNLPVVWTHSDGTPAVAPSPDSTPTAWSGTFTLPGAEAGLLLLTGTAQDGSGQQVHVTVGVYPPGTGAYHTGQYPDLFVDLLGQAPQDVQAKVDAAWNQLFHGDDTQRVYQAVGDDMAYIYSESASSAVPPVVTVDVRSEGMSYGMMIAVQLDHQAEFDRLWTWARTYMLHQEGPLRGYFAWLMNTDGTAVDANPAPDGEEWFATALLLAANRWGSGGAIDYRAEAQKILDTMLHKHEQPDRGGITDTFVADNHLVVFQQLGEGATFTDPSYHLPHFYELWARWADKDNQFWCAAAAASRAYLARAVNETTGLAPDYAQFDGTPFNPSWSTGGSHVDFRADAYRVAAHIGVDHLWFDNDPWEVTQSDRLLAFFRAQAADYGQTDVSPPCGSYALDGTCLSNPRNPPYVALAAMNAVAALAASDPARGDFVQVLWDAPIPSGNRRYYGALLYMLGLLETSGNFQIHHPATAPAFDCIP